MKFNEFFAKMLMQQLTFDFVLKMNIFKAQIIIFNSI